MPGNRKFTVVLLAMIALFASGCLEKKTNKKTTSTSNNSINYPTYPSYGTPTPSPTDPVQDPPPPGEHADLNGSPNTSIDCMVFKTSDYALNHPCREIPRVISKGCGNVGNGNSCPTPVAWSSHTWGLNSYLNSDAELNVRIIPRKNHDQGDSTTNGGGTCGFKTMGYTTLSMTVQAKRSASDTSAFASFTFDRIPVDKPSYPKKFPIPSGLTEPIVLQVTNLKWDCPAAGNCGTNPTRPMESVWHNDCVSFDLQFSTDDTRSWSRPIIQ